MTAHFAAPMVQLISARHFNTGRGLAGARHPCAVPLRGEKLPRALAKTCHFVRRVASQCAYWRGTALGWQIAQDHPTTVWLGLQQLFASGLAHSEPPLQMITLLRCSLFIQGRRFLETLLFNFPSVSKWTCFVKLMVSLLFRSFVAFLLLNQNHQL